MINSLFLCSILLSGMNAQELNPQRSSITFTSVGQRTTFSSNVVTTSSAIDAKSFEPSNSSFNLEVSPTSNAKNIPVDHGTSLNIVAASSLTGSMKSEATSTSKINTTINSTMTSSTTEPTTSEIISTSINSAMRNSALNSTMGSTITQSAAATLVAATTNSTEPLLVSSTDSTLSKTVVDSIQPSQTLLTSSISKIDSVSTTSISFVASTPQVASDKYEEETNSNGSIAGIVAGGGALIAAGATLLCFKQKNSDSRNLSLANARSSMNSMNILFETPRGNDGNSFYQELGSMEP